MRLLNNNRQSLIVAVLGATAFVTAMGFAFKFAFSKKNYLERDEHDPELELDVSRFNDEGGSMMPVSPQPDLQAS